MSTKRRKQNDPGRQTFVWITNQHYDIPVNQMETRHLFFTIRMIWNHTVPDEAKLQPYNQYRFKPPHTPEYFKEALPYLVEELMHRLKSGDMRLEWLEQFNHIQYWARRLRGEQDIKS